VTYFAGRVHSIRYEDPSQAFYIFQMVLDEHGDDLLASLLAPPTGPVPVRGYVPGLKVETGIWFGFEGEWGTHEKYGRQISISKAPVLQGGWDAEKAANILIASGVGERLVRSIRTQVGDDNFVSTLEDAGALRRVAGLAKFAAEHVAQRWEAAVAQFQAVEFLADLGLPPGKVSRIFTMFGDDAEQVLTKNPWALVQVPGIRFEQADEVARKLGLPLDNPDRVQGAVHHACQEHRDFGHMYLTTGQVYHTALKCIPDVAKADVGKALVTLRNGGHVHLDRETRPGTLAVYDPWLHFVEEESAAGLDSRLRTAKLKGRKASAYVADLAGFGPLTQKVAQSHPRKVMKVARAAVEEWGEHINLQLSEDQKRGVINSLVEPVSILTGLPGTGKTTSLRAAVNILQDADVPFLLVAPTGIAAKNLGALTGAPAFTIHRAFFAQGSSEERRKSKYTGIVGKDPGGAKSDGKDSQWSYSKDNPHPAEVVVVDEASMVDQHLMYRILDCTSETCRIVLVGDYAQLPSVGPGNVLRDLIESKRFPVIKLTEIFRQKDTSDIVFAAHAIHRGEVPKCEPPSDFSLLRAGSEEQVLFTILTLAEKLYARRINFQILSPRHAGTVGVTNLNDQLRGLLNPPKSGLREVKLGGDVMREGDRIMVFQNNYKRGVFNGDVGKIVSIDTQAKQVEIRVFGDPPLLIRLPYAEAAKLVRLAYACTVHKAQGLEYDVIVMPMVNSFYRQLQRNLLYTAITRAKKRVFLVGDPKALTKAVFNDKEDQRNTLFLDRLVAS